jgi:ankyrin repeat protein
MSEQQLILLDAIENGHTSIVLKLLRNRVNLNVTDIYGRTPLMIVCLVFDQSNEIDSI